MDSDSDNEWESAAGAKLLAAAAASSKKTINRGRWVKEEVRSK
jgi:hypothetical protein